MKLGYDMGILRHPYGGTARYAEELLAAMRAGPGRRGDAVVPYRAWPRFARGHRWLRFANLASDLAWLGIGVPASAARDRLDVWYSPSNIVPPVFPRPTVVTIHDVNFLIAPDAYERGYARYARTMIGISARKARAVITDSEFSAGGIAAAFGIPRERVRVVYPGLDHSLAAHANPEPVPGLPERYALYVGQTEPHKNVGLLLDAWSQGARDLGLVIAGTPGRDHERIVERAGRDDLAGRVLVLGRVSQGQLETLYGGAACCVQPSRAEGFGFPALEAMARGVPVAVAEAGSLPEITAGAAPMFDPDDATGLLDRVAELVTPSPARDARVDEGRTVAARYTWAAAAEQVWEIVRGVV